MNSLVAAAAVTMLTSTPDPLSESYAADQAAITKRLGEIWGTFDTKDADKLASFHAYGPKFTAFKDGAPRIDATTNEAEERGAVQALVDPKVAMRDIKVAVYGDSAIASFHGDFSGKMGGKAMAFSQACTLVFVKVKGDWKIVHEHFSVLGGPPKPH